MHSNFSLLPIQQLPASALGKAPQIRWACSALAADCSQLLLTEYSTRTEANLRDVTGPAF